MGLMVCSTVISTTPIVKLSSGWSQSSDPVSLAPNLRRSDQYAEP
jgi:hypothetical protein